MKKIFILALLPLNLFCQNSIGLPEIINYSKQVYNAGLQNWDFKQDKNGLIYIANNEGLISFDGNFWNMYPLPNKTIVRSVEIGFDNKIYVGGQDEIGFFEPAANGKLQYHSLVALIPNKDRAFGDVWDIVSYKNEILFRSSNKILKLNKQSITVYPSISEWTFMGICNNQLFVHDFKAGLLTYDNGLFNKINVKGDLPTDDPITAIFKTQQDSFLITTLRNGLFSLTNSNISKLTSPNNLLFENERIYAATKVTDEWIALATNSNGVYIIDTRGNIIQSFSRKEGIQNNNVLSIFLDNQKNLWLGLDNGIDLITYNNAIKQINPLFQNESGYTAVVFNNRLYAGTSNGLYSVALQAMKDLSFSKGNFSMVNNTKGQTWGLASVNNKLYLGKHEGAFLINESSAQKFSEKPGFWNFNQIKSDTNLTQIIAGNYKGLEIFEFKDGQYAGFKTLPDFIESSRFVAIDKYENIWVSHPYHGLYKIQKKKGDAYDIRHYKNENGLPSTLNNHVYKIKNELLIASEKGIYQYNYQKDIFEISEYYKKIIGNLSIRYLKEDASGNIWFIHEKSLGVIDFSGQEPTIIYLPELKNKMLSGFEFIYPIDKSNIIIGAEKGFFHINYDKYKTATPEFQAHIRTVRIIDKNDSLLFAGYYNNVNENQEQDQNKIPEISHNWKTIRFEFSSSIFGYLSNLEYSYRLKGYETNWSDWTKRTEKEYTNLPTGKFSFEVKVRNNLGNESTINSYAFKILPPWYQTIWAGLFYILLISVCLLFAYKFLKKKFRLQRKKFEEEQEKLLYIHELERNKTNNELIALKNEKLESEINFKNSELASSAMHLVKKGELITKLKSEILHVVKQIDNPQAIAELKKMIKTLNEDENMDEEWENFTMHFDKVHSDFVVTLKEKFPTITGNELKLCAYLRMNLSTKEIAQLLNISVRGVEISRYRLRKKLQISSDTNLFDFLINI